MDPGPTHAQPLPVPEPGPAAAVAWVAEHLGDLVADPRGASDRFRGGQQAADRQLASFGVAGYAGGRNEVWPTHRRTASQLSPYVRHGLLDLRRLWDHVEGGPAADVSAFRNELLWQEYGRHVYARMGTATRHALRHAVVERGGGVPPWPDDASMACVNGLEGELAASGWLTNQQRLWLASLWTVRQGGGWRDGEDWLFSRLLDGSRAANRLGWQWTVGASSSRAYDVTRSHVERRAPGLCARCSCHDNCPLERAVRREPEGAPDGGPDGSPVGMPAAEISHRLRRGPDGDSVAGPVVPTRSGTEGAGGAGVEAADAEMAGASVDAVWLTAESMGDADPAGAAHPSVPAVFVVDEGLLQRVSVAGMRLVFLAETLADLATRRPVEIWRGDPMAALAGRRVAATFAPVPGWRRHATRIRPSEVHPWPWLVRPAGAPLQSFSAWRRRMSVDAGL